MSLIPRNTSNTPTHFTPFPQDFWDRFFSQDLCLEPFKDLPFPFPFPTHFHPSFHFLSPHHPSYPRTVPYSELSVETSGDVRARLECKEIPEAHIIAGDLAGIEKDEVNVVPEEGGFVRISGGDGRFSWRLRLPENAKVHLMNWSMENGVITVVVPKLAGEDEWAPENRGPRNVRQIEITGLDE